MPRTPAATAVSASGLWSRRVGSARLVAPGAGLEGFCWWRDASAVRAGGRGRLADGWCASGCLRRGRVLEFSIVGRSAECAVAGVPGQVRFCLDAVEQLSVVGVGRVARHLLQSLVGNLGEF